MASRRATEPGGFSLLEMMIALAIMALLGAIALPSIRKITERTGFSLDLQDVLRQLDQLPQTAATQGKALLLISSPGAGYSVPASTDKPQEPYPVKLPEGWQITVGAPISYRYDGTCGGGKLRVSSPDWQTDFVLKAPLCELRVDK